MRTDEDENWDGKGKEKERRGQDREVNHKIVENIEIFIDKNQPLLAHSHHIKLSYSARPSVCSFRDEREKV